MRRVQNEKNLSNITYILNTFNDQLKTKNTLWEGGVRGAGFVWSPILKSAPRVANQMMNIQDWLPTLYVAAGWSNVNLIFLRFYES